MAHGGARPGAGRKRKAVLFVSPIRTAEGKIRDKLPWLVDRLMDLAGGVQVEETDREGDTVVYQRAPDRQACEYLLDRIMGKPVQPIDIRDRAAAIADELGLTVEDVLAEAEQIAAGRR